MNVNKRNDVGEHSKGSSDTLLCLGYLNGFSIEIRSPNEISFLYEIGCYGKGSSSRSKPDEPDTVIDSHKILRHRQFVNKSMLVKKFKYNEETLDDNSKKNEIIVVVPDSDSDGENYLENLKPKCYTNNIIKSQEKLHLSLQEAYYLAYKINCLKIINDNGETLSKKQSWNLFITIDSNFLTKYVIYDHYRSNGYIVKPGIKFGGDYILYKDKPSRVHADYIVLISYEDKYKTDWTSILGHVRMATTTVKEILWVEVNEASDKTEINPYDLSHYTIKEALLKREWPTEIKENNDLYCFIYTVCSREAATKNIFISFKEHATYWIPISCFTTITIYILFVAFFIPVLLYSLRSLRYCCLHSFLKSSL